MKLQGVVEINGTSVSNCTVTIGAMTVYADRSSLAFNVSYSMGTLSLADDYFVAPYSLEGDNPELQAIDYLLGLPKFSEVSKVEE